MKNLIVVQNAYEDLNITKNSIESIRYAAHRWKCNFFEITQFQFPNAPEHIFWERMWAFENFQDYDKVLTIDADCVINGNSPSIFDELTNEFDFAAVLDGNPGGRFKHDDDWYRKHSYSYHLLNNSVEILTKYLPGFDYNTYWKTYCNMGVFLFRPKPMSIITTELKKLLLNNTEFYNYMDCKKNGNIFSGNNIWTAIVSVYHQRLKLLDNTWNWLAPDDFIEYNSDMFLGKMKPNIYHFAGTTGSKDSLKTYDRWK